MTRIQLKDLPNVETLTPEEMEEILGAGRSSFQPSFEALEAREMMDASTGFLLQSMVIGSPGLVQGGHQPSQVREFTPTINTGIGEMRSEAPRMMTGQGQVADLRNMGVVDALNKGSNWILYEPITNSPGAYVGKDQIRNELQFLYNKGFRGLVTYAFDNGREEIPTIAKEIGFHQVIAGVWACNNYATEKANLTADRLSKIDGFCVGNETQLRGELSIGTLRDRVNEIKALSGKPTTTSDAWHLYQNGPHVGTELMGVGDWVFPNLHPWFEEGWADAHKDPSKGLQFVTDLMDKFFDAGTTGGRSTILHEAWWPSANEGATDSYAGAGSPENQKTFFQGLSDKHVKFVYGEAFDQEWKKEGKGYMGAFAKHWGLWHDMNSAKPVNDVIDYGYRSGARNAGLMSNAGAGLAAESSMPGATNQGVSREEATLAGNWFFNRLNTSLFTHTTIYQLHKVEYQGISSWTEDNEKRITGFDMKIHLEFDKYLGVITQEPGDLILKIQFTGINSKDNKPYYRVQDTTFLVNGSKNYAHLGLEFSITDVWKRRHFTPGGNMAPAPKSDTVAATPQGSQRTTSPIDTYFTTQAKASQQGKDFDAPLG